VKVEKEMEDEVARDGGDTLSGIGHASLFRRARVCKHEAWLNKMDIEREECHVFIKTCGYYRCTLSQPIQASIRHKNLPVVYFLYSE
jgi:hypothetical protein